MLTGVYISPVGSTEITGQEPEVKKIRIVAGALEEPERGRYLREKLMEIEILARHGYPSKAARAEVIRQILAGRKENEWKELG